MVERSYYLLNGSQVSSLGLIDFDSLKEGLEVSSSKTLVVVSLDDLAEESRSILQWLGEDLEEVALLVIVHEDLQSLNGVKVFLDLGSALGQLDSEVVVIGVWNGQELASSSLHVLDGVDDVVSSEGDMLDTWSSIVIDVLLDLGLSLSWSRLIDWHLDLLIEVCDYNRPQGRVLGVEHLVINRPKSVEVQHLFVPRSSCLHLTIRLVSDAVINVAEICGWQKLVDGLLEWVLDEAWQENTIVLVPLNESVSCISISSYRGDDNNSIFIPQGGWLHDCSGSSGDGLLEDSCRIVDVEGDIFNSITVLGMMLVEFFLSIWIKRCLKNETNLTIFNDMLGEVSVASLEALISNVIKTESRAVVTGCLLSVSDPECNMIEAVEDSNFRSDCWFLVVHCAKVQDSF